MIYSRGKERHNIAAGGRFLVFLRGYLKSAMVLRGVGEEKKKKEEGEEEAKGPRKGRC